MIKVHDELCPFSETVHFLYSSKFATESENEMISTLNKLELNGKEVYNKYFDSYRKFIEVFKNNRISNSADDFFIMGDRYFYHVMGDLAKQIHDNPITDVEINKKIITNYLCLLNGDDPQKKIKFGSTEIPTFEEIFDFLINAEIDDRIKWKLVTFVKNPQKYMNELIELVKLNLPAFEKATTTVKKELDGYLESYRNRMKKRNNDPFYKTASEFESIKNIIPTFANPEIQWYGTEYAVYGLLSDIFKELLSPEEDQKKNMLAKFKVLSDASRLEILLTLKESAKYSLEIAELLGLAPSTVSHHMNLLYVNELVSFTQISGKVYYNLERENFEQLQKSFQHFFLE